MKAILGGTQTRKLVARATNASVSSRLVSSLPLESSSGLRRPRKYSGRFKDDDTALLRPAKQVEPYTLGEDGTSLNEYLQKASLSPWVPLPDSVARKMMDLAAAGPDDLHVDLGCGDGRVNFHAVDGFNVSQTLGVDIDATLVARAHERLAKRHPRPTHVDFVTADLVDTTHIVWTRIQQATLITMYFTDEALRKLRPILEYKLRGCAVKLVTCGYEMPGWSAVATEVVLGTSIHLYEWGLDSNHSEDATDSPVDMFLENHEIQQKLDQLTQKHLEGNKFAGSNVIDRTNNSLFQGYNPNLKLEEEDDDEDWDELDKDDDTPRKPPPKKTTKTSACSKR